jgi:hypothetical protein
MLCCIIAALLYARRQAITVYGTDAARKDWQKWVEDAREQQSGSGPIRRRAPTTDRPPALILMRDYFITCLAAAIVLPSAVYWSFAFMLNGVLTQRRNDFETMDG